MAISMAAPTILGADSLRNNDVIDHYLRKQPMSEDEDWITEDMDDYLLGTPQKPEYVAPNDYSYVDPETGLTPKQQAYLDYKRA